MKKKNLVTIAFVMIIVFGGTILMYPRLFNPDAKETADQPAPPAVVQTN